MLQKRLTTTILPDYVCRPCRGGSLPLVVNLSANLSTGNALITIGYSWHHIEVERRLHCDLEIGRDCAEGQADVGDILAGLETQCRCGQVKLVLVRAQQIRANLTEIAYVCLIGDLIPCAGVPCTGVQSASACAVGRNLDLPEEIVHSGIGFIVDGSEVDTH